jgi:hypothetical protein
VVFQAGEDGAEDVVVQRLRRRTGAGAKAGTGASAALERRGPAPAPAAARLHVGRRLLLLSSLPPSPVRTMREGLLCLSWTGHGLRKIFFSLKKRWNKNKLPQHQ